MRYRATRVEVDLSAIRDNVKAIKPKDSELMAVVKANAYGHGDIEVSRAALEAGATWLGVALVEEGVRLRDAGIQAPVLMLSEFPTGSEADALAAGLTPTIYSLEGLERLKSAASAGQSVHLKVDTGMHRVGVWPPSELAAFAEAAQASGLVVDGIWTHFASADSDDATTLGQLKEFLIQLKGCVGVGVRPRVAHAANSAALLRHEETHLDIVRPGIAVLGLTPGVTGPIRPALSWRSEVTFSRKLSAGESLSYGHTYTLESDSTVATVPVGYADGFSRRLSSQASVLIRGRRFPVAGSVTMDQALIDCGDVDIRAGEEVVLLGSQGEETITAEELAALNGTINYEIVCAIGERVPREYVG